MSTDDLIKKGSTAKAELSADLAHALVHEGSEVLREGSVVAAGSHVRAVVRGREVDSFTSFDFLGLSTHPRIQRAAARALGMYGVGYPLPREAGGFTAQHGVCEQRMALFYGAESAVVFGQRSQAILSSITTFCRQGDLVLAGLGYGGGLADACAVADVEYDEFESFEGLERQLERHRADGRSYRRVVLCVESVSSTTGDACDLVRLFGVAEKYGWLTVIDESAGFGVFGGRGAGSAELFPRHPSLLARWITLAPMSGIDVAVVVGPREMRELLYRRSNYLRRECPPSPVAIGAAIELIDLVEVAGFQRGRAMAYAGLVVQELQAQGWSVSGGRVAPLVVVAVESQKRAYRVQAALLDQGILVGRHEGGVALCAGAVLRIALSAVHAQESVARLLAAFAQARARVG